MLKQILRSIRAMLAALPRFVTERFFDGVRWISRLVAMPAPVLEPDVDPAGTAADTGDAEHIAALRTVASHFAAGSNPPADAVQRLREADLEWLMALPRPMLCRVAVASDVALAAHIRRQRPMPGLLAHDPAAVADYQRSVRMERARRDDTEAKLDFIAA
ncbi:hypothetical protein [Devosia salina]|uniref:Uncharacterized protein n=1 Tax=Devosia salina TaxID=2860336 RepID=A0ABX8WJ72_9HYPH|nr:hypothetical protein [Devosia salina]QYO78393.1 hypothetical protein K1X15_07560 [Devosia salina]